VNHPILRRTVQLIDQVNLLLDELDAMLAAEGLG
jgi:hypothetical protein